MGRLKHNKSPVEIKEAQQKHAKRTNGCRIYIGNQAERWKELSSALGVSSTKVAKLLLDRYEMIMPGNADRDPSANPLQSPGLNGNHPQSPGLGGNHPQSPGLSGNRPKNSGLNGNLHQTTGLRETPSQRPGLVDRTYTAMEEGTQPLGVSMMEIEATPFASMAMPEGTIPHEKRDFMNIPAESRDSSFSDEGGTALSNKDGDKSYAPADESLFDYDMEMSINKREYYIDDDDLPEIKDSDLIHDIGPDEEDNHEEPDEYTATSDISQLHAEGPQPMVLAQESCIIDLAAALSLNCPTCRTVCSVTKKTIGTALKLTWICQRGHKCKSWTSQPRLGKKGVYAGDFVLASSILLSGNNHRKVALLMKFAGLKPMNATFFYKIQSHYAIPVIKQHWKQILDGILTKYQGTQLVLAGDGRCDSPGHSSMYCTYTLMVEATHDIIAMVIVDKRDVQLKSPNMEPEGLRKALDGLKAAGISVKEVVTDAHSQIPPILRERKIEHQWDVWHGAKNLSKKLNQAASVKGCEDLKPWVRHIVTHFWTACEIAKGCADVFKQTMMGTLHHLVNEHEWGLDACSHEPLLEADRQGKKWLDPDSQSMEAVRKVIGDKTWLKQASEHYVNFRPPAYEARMLLAAIDFEEHKDREHKCDKNGNLMFSKIYSKRSRIWYPTPVKVSKEYSYIPGLIANIVQQFLDHPERYMAPVILGEHDPRHIQKNKRTSHMIPLPQFRSFFNLTNPG